MRFSAIFVSAMLLVAVACSENKKVEEHSTPEAVVTAAYNHLIKGEYEEYVANVQSADSIPDKYRAGLITAAKQFVVKEKEENGGIKSVAVIKEKTNTKDTYSLVMLTINYADGTSEEVAVPVVKVNGSWRLK